ncbi:MAG TPA: hypothetical protein VKF41_04370 [Bryobacteraceae bacterium]|nr:hypothetical protein [Bryobacteraceae bacterium]
MKTAAVLFALFLAPAWAQLPRPPAAAPVTASAAAPAATVTPTEKPRVPRQAISDLERQLDKKLASLGSANDPIDLLGAARGIYLDGYGVVLTVEISPIITPGLNPFKSSMTDAEKEKIRQRKLDRLPMLRQTMRDVWRDSATSLASIPDNQQVVVAVRLLYLSWEDTHGLPGEIVMKGDRRTAISGTPQMEER